MIVKEINENDFIEEFKNYHREDNFSYKGLIFLYNYLYDLSIDIDKPINLDIISLCCDYSEYKNVEDYLNDYENSHNQKEEYEEEEDFKKRIEEEINYKTTLIKFGNDLNEGFIIQQY